ncbi:MAG TPA: N-acetyl-gamma-glutamyl-phosphate reductase [Gemmatimonadales bacterium]|jgi:N-acetyl-gamma-glutamyl-phosphate reductase common form|nr:N-acetyl-gamma-glutamyl-phosphate reductase [Gemmatimonadales bacterium]
MKVAVIGGAGYAGGELLRLMLQHPSATEVTVTSRSQAGKPIASVHPALALLTDARFAAHAPAEVARGKDVVFLSLEHGESTELMGTVIDAGPGLIVDIAADFRIHDGRLHERYYGAHTAPALVHRFRYGLADVLGTELRGATAIAAPGCFATAAQLALYTIADLPLAAAPAIFAVTGSSGAGQKPKASTHHPARAHNMFAYSVMGHRHEGEVLEQWRTWRNDPAAQARLMCHSGPFVRGIYATLHATLAEPVSDIGAHAAARFAGRPFVRILDTPPELTHAVGTNMALISAMASPDGREVQIMCTIDNLVKGAGGQAIQAMNLALGLDERAGLLAAAPFPC